MELLNNPAVLIGAFVLIFNASILVIAHLLNKKQASYNDRFFQQLGASGEDGDRLIAFAGHQIRIDYFQGGRNSPSCLSLTVLISQGPPLGTWRISKERSADVFLEKIGLEGKIAVDDPQFNSSFHIASNDDDKAFALAYFNSPKKREAVSSLFTGGCTYIELDEGGLKMDLTFRIKSGTDAQPVKECLHHLTLLAENLPPSTMLPTAQGLSKRRFDIVIRVATLAVYAALIPLVFAAVRMRPLGDELFSDSLRYSVPVVAAFLLWLIVTLRGKSWFLSALAQSLFLIIIIPYCGCTAEVYLNGSLDNAAPVTHKVMVIDKHEIRGRDSTSYRVRIPSWRQGHDSEELTAHSDDYPSIQPGHTVAVVTTRPGYFGYEWVVSHSFAATK